MTDKVEFSEESITVEEFENRKKQIQKDGLSVISSKFKETFEKHPELEAIYFTAFTPYFNDGDPCVYGIGWLEIKLNNDVEKALQVSSVTDFDPNNPHTWTTDIP